MRILFALLLIWLSATAAPAQQQGEIRQQFKAWLATCRVDGYCSATAYQNPNFNAQRVADYIFRIGRHAQQSYWELSFTPVLVGADEGKDFTVTVDGHPQSFGARTDIGVYGAINHVFLLDDDTRDFFLLGTGAQNVLDRLVPGITLSVDFTDNLGRAQRATFSLAGLTASLAWIDEQQRRLGSERVAAAPPALATTESGDMPVPVALLNRIASDPDCLPFDEIANGNDISTGTLDDEHTLYVLPCWSGAYNFGWKIYVESGDGFDQVLFADYDATLGWTGTDTLVNVEYNDTTKELRSFNRGRGIGDCGNSGLWRWRGEGFQLVEFRSKHECDEKLDDWPVIYSASP
jgi:hypothetical protein